MTARVPACSLARFSLDGKVAIVTGASGGIGRVIAHGFSDVGVRQGDRQALGGGLWMTQSQNHSAEACT